MLAQTRPSTSVTGNNYWGRTRAPGFPGRHPVRRLPPAPRLIQHRLPSPGRAGSHRPQLVWVLTDDSWDKWQHAACTGQIPGRCRCVKSGFLTRTPTSPRTKDHLCRQSVTEPLSALQFLSLLSGPGNPTSGARGEEKTLPGKR